MTRKSEPKTDQKPKRSAPKEKTVSIKESELNKLKEEAADYKDRYVRLYAEFDNARKRTDRERGEFVKYANEGLLTEFLTILDGLELSVKAAREKHEDYEAFLKGVEMIMGNISEMLKKNDVKEMDPKGKKFDHNAHEVLMQEESAEADEGEILEVFQKGYTFGDRVLRTAKVKVARRTGEKKDNGEQL